MLRINPCQLIAHYQQALALTKINARVTSTINVIGRTAQICLLSQSNHLVGAAFMSWNPLFYKVKWIKVSEDNKGRGLGRILILESTLLAVTNGSHIIMPPFSFTKEGKIAFLGYPLLAQTILQQKTLLAQANTKPANDTPWKEPTFQYEDRFR